MSQFQLVSPYKAAGDQPKAIDQLVSNVTGNIPEQILLGVTGSGKTYTMARVIEALQRPTLIISHNKTLAAQLYQEFRDFFPNNAVSYFVSYYDYYQPEAYVVQTDTYIEKETQINEDIDKLRLAATTNLLTRPDTIIVASVSCIYNIGSPKEYGHFVLELARGMEISRDHIFDRLVHLQYERSDFGFHRGTFRVRGETIDLFPAYADCSLRVVIEGNIIRDIVSLDPISGKRGASLPATVIYPAKHYMTDPKQYAQVFERIRADLDKQLHTLATQGKSIEAHRLKQRVNFDLEMIQEMGYVNGIENYSRYFDGRDAGDAPYTLFDYFTQATKSPILANSQSTSYSESPNSLARRSFREGEKLESQKDWLLFVDESHMTIPQIRGMYNGDRARKQTLIDYGFRLPSALDNRPLTNEEFLRRIPQTIYVSATPSDWEVNRVKPQPNTIIEQLIRPTGLLDPEVEVRPSDGQIDDLIKEIRIRVEKKERVLVTTLTKRMAEDLTKFIADLGILVQYIHSDVQTLDRSDILSDLRLGTFDVVVGINLLREGLDLPEVSLVAILDADKEGFLRSRVSLIQTMGRAARHEQGKVILYADRITDSMAHAMEEVRRRREIQKAFNAHHGITPQTIKKPIRDRLVQREKQQEEQSAFSLLHLPETSLDGMTPKDKHDHRQQLEKAMKNAAKDLNFELAATIRDHLKTLQ